jgi:hypothetical protein
MRLVADVLDTVVHILGPAGLSAFGLLLFLAILRAPGRLRGVTAQRDPARRFSRAQKAELLRRAGGRCEHHHPLYGRCDQLVRLEADHVHPHSRGGWTDLSNGQALCRRHNKAKWTRVPNDRDLRRLAKRRALYYPPGVPVQVVRRAPRGTPAAAPPPVVAPPPVTTLMAPPKPRPAPTALAVPPVVEPAEVRRFGPPRAVEVLVDGSWRPGLHQGWRRDGETWTADVSWFAGYAVAEGRQVARVRAGQVRLPRVTR